MIFEDLVVVGIAFLALGASLAGIIWLIFLERRLRKFFRGGKGEDMGGVLAEIQECLRYFAGKERKVDEILSRLETRVGRSVQHLGVVRFNPYSDVGGDQSFSIAVLDEKQNGFVMTGLYGREQSRIYAKPVEKGRSTHQLSEEEKTAMKKAIGRYA